MLFVSRETQRESTFIHWRTVSSNGTCKKRRSCLSRFNTPRSRPIILAWVATRRREAKTKSKRERELFILMLSCANQLFCEQNRTSILSFGFAFLSTKKEAQRIRIQKDSSILHVRSPFICAGSSPHALQLSCASFFETSLGGRRFQRLKFKLKTHDFVCRNVPFW